MASHADINKLPDTDSGWEELLGDDPTRFRPSMNLRRLARIAPVAQAKIGKVACERRFMLLDSWMEELDSAGLPPDLVIACAAYGDLATLCEKRIQLGDE